MKQALLDLLARSLSAAPLFSAPNPTDGARVALLWDPSVAHAPVCCAMVAPGGAPFWRQRYPDAMRGACAYLARCQDWRVDPFPDATLKHPPHTSRQRELI